jgi:septal ring factor EnvC (AmiA/AmiB activator)
MILKYLYLLEVSLLFVIGVASGVQADEATQKRAQLEAIRNELASKRALYDSLGTRERGEMARLRDLEQQVTLSGQLLLKISRESNRLKRSITTQKLQLQITEAKREARADLLKRRLVYIYKTGDHPAWLELLSTGDPSLALVEIRNLKSLVEYDRHLVASYHDLSVSIETGLRRYRRDISELETLKDDQEKELASRKNTLTSRKRLLDNLKKDKKEVRRSISSLEDDAKDIAGILERLELESSQAGYDSTLPGLDSSKGNLVWPARGRILREFGLTRDKRGIVLSNPGIDIEAKAGADVLAAASGEVIYINWLRGYGQFVILDHGRGYYTLYANLSDVLVESGDRVKAGELIALAGDSGSLEGPKLHFEVRHKKDQLNPVEWLR